MSLFKSAYIGSQNYTLLTRWQIKIPPSRVVRPGQDRLILYYRSIPFGFPALTLNMTKFLEDCFLFFFKK